jgi:uncharacterized protein YbbC (DUF1343 family)
VKFFSFYIFEKIFLFLTLLILFEHNYAQVRVGAVCTEKYLAQLTGKRIALCCNQTSRVDNIHLLDTLRALNVDVSTIFSPEHGFRGDAEAGAKIHTAIDERTGLSVISLYGQNKKPTSTQLKNIDLLIFDMQDVGCRFYTYISTLHYVMEAAAENQITVMVLDRPNPNGYFVDGPLLDTAYRSFVGMHPVPIVHGMTIGEYALMINGEKWLKNGIQCSLQVIPVEGWTHSMRYSLPIKPSPNLPTPESVYLYPSLCLFEGTSVSVGRGTDKPFQVYGHPLLNGDYSFKPQPIKGVAENPPQAGKVCYGEDLTQLSDSLLFIYNNVNISYLMKSYKLLATQATFFNADTFDHLAGSAQLRQQLIAGMTESEIYDSWKTRLNEFKQIRKKYLLYPDFE